MRVLYSFPHPLGRPGIGTTAYHQVAGLLRSGLEVTLFCTSVERALVGNVRVVETLVTAGKRIPHRALGVDRAYRYHDWRVSRSLLSGRLRPHVVHAWPRASVKTFGTTRNLGIAGVREVPNTHTAYAFDAVAREEARLGLDRLAGHSHSFDPHILAREEAEYQLADLLLAPSDFVRRTFLAQGMPDAKVARHRYGCDLDVFIPGDGRSPLDGLRALFVGSCEPRKGLHYALQAWFESGAAETGRFVVCGGFVPDYREKLAQWIEHPSVDVRGFVDDPASLMRESDVFLFPSIEEGSALVTYEAQASGCVLLASDAAGACVTHDVEGLIHEAGDVATLTRQLRVLDEDRARLRSLREATLAARDNLSWDAAAAALIEIYDRAAGRTRSAV